VYTAGQVLCHGASGNRLDDHTLGGLAPVCELSVTVELGTVEKTTGPCEHRGYRVGGSLTTLLMHAVMSGDSAMSGLSLNGAIRSLENGGHETERAVALSDDIGLHVTIVVRAGPDEATVRLDGVGDHVVDETMLVPETSSLELGLVGALVHLLEDILKATIVFFQDGVLGGQVAWVVP
jgi:hypothetical protein